MTDALAEKIDVSSSNGGPEPYGLEAKSTVLARDDVLSGKLQVRSGGQVLGNFSGQIECDGDLLIGPDAHVEANIRSERVTISGFVKGNIVASNRLKITTTGRLEGDAKVGALVVQEGGVHLGVIRVHPEGLPDSEPVAIVDATPRAPVVAFRTLPSPVGKVRKFWGEFF
ncbi:MAG TPA: polymer-forming cytoskeletal protein [Candidatus Dormibacteraeota bacterium]|nr:polymer-forming cytoskeletal protein [Candidatus Dormibacteraeota bacterium]